MSSCDEYAIKTLRYLDKDLEGHLRLRHFVPRAARMSQERAKCGERSLCSGAMTALTP